MPEIIFDTGSGYFSGDISANDASFNNVDMKDLNASNISTDIINYQNLEFKRNNTTMMNLYETGTITTLDLEEDTTASGTQIRLEANNSFSKI